MKLTLKCLIDFRSWLGENHNMRMWEFKELPEFVQNAYMFKFFDVHEEEVDEYLLSQMNKNYNTNFQKELDENNKK